MNRQSAIEAALVNRNQPLGRSRLCKVFVLLLMTLAWVQVEAQSPQSPDLAVAFESKKNVTKPAKVYVCPMHPTVKSTKPGKCPKCSMALRLARPDTTPAAAADAEPVADSVAASTTLNNASGAGMRMSIPDVEVLDQNGNALHFYRDLIKGKTVAINFIFTNCTTICPPLAATFARVQKEMGDKVGRDVHFISISVDPLTDTPERLKAWGARFKAGDGWTFVTGDKQEIDKLLNALGASVSRREDHSPTVIVGNDLQGIWTRTYGLARTAQMVGLIVDVMERKAEESQTRETAKP